MLAISRSVIGLLAVLVTVLEIKYAQADCPIPTKGKNVEVKYPSRSVIRNRWVKEDSVVRFSCSKGFLQVKGDKIIVCLNGKWKAKGPQGFRSYTHFQCTEKQCPVKDIVNGKMVVTNKHDVTYSCNRGYGLKGFQHAHCREDENGDFYLTSPLPTCEPLLKCDRPIAPNLRINGSCCYAGDEVTYLCEQGYTIEGVSSAVCLQTGNWSQPAPYCMRSKQCRNPGTPARSNISGDCCEVGSVLTFDCHDGYELMDEEKGNSVTCLANEKWNEAIPQCKPIGIPACPNIPFQENNLTTDSMLPSNEDVFLDGSEVDLECKDGYYSEAAEMYLLCLSDGTWDVEVPVCKPKYPCSRPLPPSNGHITKLTDNPTQMKFPILYEMVMECDRGYISQTGRYGTWCEGNDVWKNYLNCTRIRCSDPGIPKNGYRKENDFHFNSSVTFSCMSSYELIGSSVRTCQENGRWSGFTTVCDAGESDCVDPGVPVNSKRVGYSFNIGDIVTYSCKKRTTLIGNATRECLDDEDGTYWSGSEIECRGQNEYTDYDEATRVLSETMGSVKRPGLQCTGMACIARTLGNVNKTGVSGTDVFFAFDGSASITEPEFKRAKDFALTVIRQLDISQRDGGVRVAVTIFSKDAEEIAHLKMKTVGEITKAINDMKGNRKGTDLRKGLTKIMDFAERSIEASPNRKKIAFVLTDGMWNQGGDPTSAANQLVDPNIYNVEVYAIGIGKPRNDDALMKIAGLNKDRVLILKDYEELVNIAAKAIKRDLDYSACGFERPVSLSDTIKGNRKKTYAGRFGKILGGQDVERPWPWMAALSKEGKTACGGSIIHQQWILTAAHCFRTKPDTKVVPSDWLVTVGATNLGNDTGWDLRVSDIFLHENYNTYNLDFDAALMKLKVQVPYDLYIRPICLPPKFKDMPKNTGLYSTDNEAMVIGYGHTEVMKFDDDRAKSVDKLQELELKLQSNDVCQKNVTHENFIVQPTPQMICAGSGLGKKDACKGDSGGPLMQMTISTSRNNTQDRWFLVGIKSWGIGCGLEGYYGYYSYVAKIREWVENITKVEFENVIPHPIARG